MSGASWDAVTGTDRHLASALAKHVDVLWVDPPMSWLARRRRQLFVKRLTEPAPGVTRLHTVAPPGVGRPVVRAVARLLLRAQVRWTLWRLGVAPIGVIHSSPELLMCGISGTKVLFATDDFVAGAGLLGL